MTHTIISKKLAIVATCMLAVALAACASCSPRKVLPKEEGNVETVAVEFQWSPESDCSICHIAQEASMDDVSCLASAHASQMQCVDCHSDEAGLTAVHVDASAQEEAIAKRLKETSVDDSLCMSCHGDYGQLAEKTAACLALTDANGLVANPHALPPNVEHDDIACSSCHAMHDDEGAGDNAKKLCLSCHHQNVFECFTCHA